MKIVLDAMGSDRHPVPDVEGGVAAAREYGAEIIFVGQQEVVAPEVAKHDTSGLKISLVHASQVIEMTDEPAMAARTKKDSSMAVGMRLVQQGEADAFVTCGNSGGALAAALFYLGRLKGVKRPALASVFPTVAGPAFLLDLGANTDCKPEYLLQFGVMGSAYAERVLGIANPRVAIVSTGEEEGKGSTLAKEAYKLLKASQLNFIGNAEGKDIPAGFADVIVTDGFTGNVIVKLSEGVASLILTVLEREIKARPLAVLGALLARNAFRAVKRALDYSEYGGGPLLGVNGVVIVGHGRSNAKAVKNAVRVAMQSVQANLIGHIRSVIEASLTLSGEEDPQPVP
ncbi:MAG: phosphate acyltransferase PlsX [Chloroflexi bacterium]|nr:phosphate acyltransferase PlsX [Chloroflexota bacterium]